MTLELIRSADIPRDSAEQVVLLVVENIIWPVPARAGEYLLLYPTLNLAELMSMTEQRPIRDGLLALPLERGAWRRLFAMLTRGALRAYRTQDASAFVHWLDLADRRAADAVSTDPSHTSAVRLITPERFTS